MNDNQPFTIGRAAAQAGVNLETLRYYEERGLLPKPPRGRSGYRLFRPDDVRRVKFIKHAQMLGFSLNEIAELLSLRVARGTTCADIKQRAEKKILAINEKIQGLKYIKKALSAMSASCRGRGPTSECPILEALDRDSDKP